MDHAMHGGRTRWWIFAIVLAAVSIGGVFVPDTVFRMDDLSPELQSQLNKADIAWMITATALVMLMTPGLSFFYGGMVRKKNVISTMTQSVIAMGLVSVLWVVVGFSLSFGDSIGGFVGDPRTFFMFRNVGGSPVGIDGFRLTIPLALFALFQLKFAIITPALFTGSFAERVHFSGYLIFMVLFSIFIYSP
ncbi:MAG: ammonia channel protein, partial [Planctomycetia bacterium]|nr:ammonia channel protein [Planctomycetia bacterium]